MNTGDEVMLNNYAVRGDKRVKGEIVKQVTPSTYIVKDEQGVNRRRHIDQMIKCNNQPTLRRSSRLNKK